LVPSLWLSSGNQSTADSPNADKIAYSAAVPEPGTGLMLLVGLVFLSSARRRQQG